MSTTSSLTTTKRATTTPPGQSYEICQCEFCDGYYPHSIGFNRRFCRRDCKYRSIARDLLTKIKFDHRYCASCYRKLKTISPPTLTEKSARKGKPIPDAAIGRQNYHDHAVPDVRNVSRGSAEHSYPSVIPEVRMTCSCPVNHHTTVDRPTGGLSKSDAIQHTDRLTDTLDALYEEQVHDTEYDTDVLFSFVKQAKSRPGLQGRDQEILRNGLALAIREHQ